jgi:hypothetical protein
MDDGMRKIPIHVFRIIPILKRPDAGPLREAGVKSEKSSGQQGPSRVQSHGVLFLSVGFGINPQGSRA